MEVRMSMSLGDLKRIEVLTGVEEGCLKQSKGSRILGTSSMRRFSRRPHFKEATS